MKLKTNRLNLREYDEEDSNRLSELLNNYNITKWLLVYHYPFTLQDAEKTLNHLMIRKKENPRTSYNLAIELKKTKELIGGIGLVKINYEQKTAMVMYWVGETFWGKGHGTEALREVLDFAFNHLKLRKVSAEVYPGNNGSLRLLEKFNFKKEGYHRESVICKADGEIKDTHYYGLLNSEFIEKQ